MLGYLRMRAVQLAVLIMLSLLAYHTGVASAHTSPCTRQTCPEGPVQVYFLYSNCTGDVAYFPARKSWNTCVNKTTSSQFHSYNDLYIQRLDYTSNNNCSNGGTGFLLEGERKFYGVCIVLPPVAARDALHNLVPFDARSYMYLLSVNHTFVGAQEPETTPNTNIPQDRAFDAPCNDVESCASIGFYYVATHQNDSCIVNDPNIAWTVKKNVSENTCYRYGSKYFSYGCADAFTLQTIEYTTSDCTRPALAKLSGFICGESSVQTSTCTAPATPFSPPTQPITPTLPQPTSAQTGSDASSIQISFLLFVALAFLTL